MKVRQMGEETKMRCPHCGQAVRFGVVGRAAGRPDEWAMADSQRWSADTLARAEQEASERESYAARGVEVFMGRRWEAVPLV